MTDERPEAGESLAPTPGVHHRPAIVTVLIGVVLVGATLVLMRLAAPVLNPVLIALFLIALALPGFNWLQRKGVRRGPALVTIVLIVAVGGLALVWLGLLAVSRLQTGLATYDNSLTEIEMVIQSALGTLPAGDSASSTGTRLPTSVLATMLGGIASVLATLAFSIVLTAFLLLEIDRFKHLYQTGLDHRPVLDQAPRLANAVVRYVGVRAKLNLITGAGVAVLLLILGIDDWLLWGVVTFFLSFIPYLGLTLAMVPPVLLGYAEFGLRTAIIIVVATVAANLIVENVLEPTMTGRALQLSPSIVFVSFFVWTWLLGPAGAMLSMPITVMIMLVLDSDERTRWAARIFGRQSLTAPASDGPVSTNHGAVTSNHGAGGQADQ